MFLLLGAFIAGMLTVLAPCVLPLLPVIIGGSLAGDVKDRKRPVIIAVSLAISLILFTLLLKATTLLINIPPKSINYFSGGLIIALGIVTLIPSLYARLIGRLGIEQGAQKVLGKGYSSRRRLIGPIVTGAALGPVFSSCSPVYAYILATVLPSNFTQAMIYIVAYVLGLSLLLLAIGYYGQGFIARIKFAANPKGWFQRTLAVIFILVGVSILTGYNVKFQTYVSQHTPFDFDALSSKLLPASGSKTTAGLFNVKPYQAPEFTDLQGWINSDPQSIKQLKGKVVLVDFWTYSCINCIRNNPYLEKWYQTYNKDGLVVVGLHAPEFAFEKLPDNVKRAVKQQGITYPVGLDNNFSTWNAYGNQSWPTSYLINADGQVVRVHSGEGEYAQEEDAIRQLLTDNGADLSGTKPVSGSTKVPVTSKQTPETYLGTDKQTDYTGSPALGAAASNNFTPASPLPQNGWTLGGKWNVTGQYITAAGPSSTLSFKVAARDVYVVGGSDSPQAMMVLVDGKPVSQTGNAGSDVRDSMVTVGESQLYRLVHFKQFSSGSTVTLQVPAGIQLNVFTFGS